MTLRIGPLLQELAQLLMQAERLDRAYIATWVAALGLDAEWDTTNAAV